jgi:hypothetical protein
MVHRCYSSEAFNDGCQNPYNHIVNITCFLTVIKVSRVCSSCWLSRYYLTHGRKPRVRGICRATEYIKSVSGAGRRAPVHVVEA